VGGGAGHALVKNAVVPQSQVLPNFEKAEIPEAKLAEYVLNPEHDVGGHKARLFSSILGITRADRQLLARAILDGLAINPAVHRGRGPHGDLYQVDVQVTGPKARGTVRTGWIIRETGGAPSLTTAIVLKEKR
jgi:filamentous hemagglutinin